MRPHRLLEPSHTTVHHHLQERLAANCRVARCGVTSGLVPSAAWLKALSPAVGGDSGLTVHGLRHALHSSDVAVQRAAARLQECVLQPEWRAALSVQQLPPAPWSVSPCAGFVYWHHAPDGGRGFAVQPDGRLAPLAGDCASTSSWVPAAVAWCPVAKGQQLLVQLPPPEHLVKEATADADSAPPKLQPYLLGAWQDVWVDPNVWAVGPQHVSHYLVKSAARRVLLLGLRASDPGLSMVHGRQPKLWPGVDGSGGLLALEDRWQAVWSRKCSRLRAQARSARRRMVAAAPAVPLDAGAVITGRVHPLERAAAAAQKRGQHSGVFADSYDALLVGVEAAVAVLPPPWRLAYQALRLRRLDRVTRHFGWCLLHVALWCGAATVAWCHAAGLQA